MPLSPQVIHVVPLRITLSDTAVTISCDDPRASIVDGELFFTFNPLDPNDPDAQQRVAFVVEDPPDSNYYDNYLQVSSAPPLERLVPWRRSGTISRSPEFLPGADLVVVAILYGMPLPTTATSTAVKVGYGQRPIKIRSGAGLPGGF